jgi:hypothetical protein
MSISFDPSLPADDSLVDAGELRNQFLGLQDEIDSANSNAEGRAFKPNLVNDLAGLTISNPPTQAQVTALRDKVNELITALKT